MNRKPHKLTEKEKQLIIADYLETQNYSQVARKHNISDYGVRKVVDANMDVKKRLEEKKEEIIEDTLQYMEKQHESKKRILDKILNAIEQKSENIDMFTNIKDLATAYGIIVDKEFKLYDIKNKGNNEDEFAKVDELLSKIREEASK